MNDCAESQTRICKAYIHDCYGHLATSYNRCKSVERQILKKNIFDMLDKIKVLLDNKEPDNYSVPVDETDNNEKE